MFEDQKPINIPSFLGVFDRGRTDSTPFDHWRDALNQKFTLKGHESRHGSSLLHTVAGVLRAHVYERVGEAPRLLVLVSGGVLYDSLDFGTPLITVAAAMDFSVAIMFNRAYITFHDGNTGLPGSFLYVYDGTTFRLAAGVHPTGFTIGASTGSSGNVEKGKHLIAVAFETVSGFITQPGPDIFTLYTAPGNRKVTISNIPVGGAEIANVYVLCSKIIPDPPGYNNNQRGFELFFAPGGKVANGVTSVDLSFFDADLVQSADYLFDQLEQIPAGLGLFNYGGNLVSWGENANQSTVRVAKSGYPENFSAVDGFVLVDPGQGGGVKNCIEHRGILMMHKSYLAYGTKNNGAEATSWDVNLIDAGVGGEVHCASKVLNVIGNNQDIYLLADRGGLKIFNGSFSLRELSWKIKDIWSRINLAAFNTVQVIVEPANNRIFINVPLDGASSPSHVLYADYSEGLDAKNIKWCAWQFPIAPKTILLMVDNTTKQAKFIYGGADNIYVEDQTSHLDVATAIESYVTYANLRYSDSGEILQLNGLRSRMVGSGNLQIDLYTEDDDVHTSVTPIVLSSAPGKHIMSFFNIVNEKFSVRLRVNATGEYFKCDSLTFFGMPLFAERPNV